MVNMNKDKGEVKNRLFNYMSQNFDKKQLPVRFDLNQPQNKQIVNNLLFTFTEEVQEIHSLKQPNQNSLIIFQSQPESLQQLQELESYPAQDQQSKQLNQSKNSISTPAVLKKGPSQTKISSIKPSSKFLNNLNKDFVLELQKKDSTSQSKESFTDFSKSSDGDNQESDEDFYENSEIMNLKKKEQWQIIDEVEEKESLVVDYDSQNYEQAPKFNFLYQDYNVCKKKYSYMNKAIISHQLLKLLNNQYNQKYQLIFSQILFIILQKGDKLKMQQNKSSKKLDKIKKKKPVKMNCNNSYFSMLFLYKLITNKRYSFEYIDLSNLLFFYLYMVWYQEFENLKYLHNLFIIIQFYFDCIRQLHEYCQKHITDDKIENLFTYQPFYSTFEIKINMKDKMKEIIQLENCQDEIFKILVQSYFQLIRQSVFESSLHYEYLVEFNLNINIDLYQSQLTQGLQYQQTDKFEFYISKQLFIQVMLQQNENYVKIFRENTYYLQFDTSQNNFDYINQCQYQNQQNPHPILNDLVMVYFYTIEKLNPKLIKKVIQKMIKRSENEKEIINLCLQNNNFYILYYYYQNNGSKIKGWIEDFENQQLMIKALSRCTGINFLSLLFFIRKIQLWSQKDLIHMMAYTLNKRLDVNRNDNNFLFTFLNPIKTIVLIIEILTLTIKNEFFHKHILQNTRKKYTNFAQKLIKNALEEEQAFDIFVDSDLEGRKLLYIIHENSMDEFIASDKVQEVIDILWHGNSTTTFNFSIGQNLTNPALQLQAAKNQKQCIEYPFDDSYQSEDFIGRLSVWENQIQFRNSINQFFLILFMVLFLAYFLDSFAIFTEGFMPVRDDIDLVKTTISKLQNNLSKWILVYIFVGINLPLNAITNLNYLNKYEKNAKFNVSQIFDITFGILTNFYAIFIYTLNAYAYENSQAFMIYFLNILTICCYIRFILCLTATKAFGIILQALSVIFIEVAKFFNPFIAILILFVFVGFILFSQMESGQFHSFVKTLFFLVEAMFGQFKFQDFLKQYAITGSLFMIVFMYSLNIILMNVLVAILAFNFEKTNRQARILHYQHIIYHVRQGNYIQKHGCLILVPILLEFIAIPYFIMKKIFKSNSQVLQKCDKFYIYLSYSPIFVFTIICTVVFNLILLPFAYLQRLLTLLKFAIYRYVKFHTVLSWLFLGIFFLLKRLFYNDMKELFRYMFSSQSSAEQANQKQKKLKFDSNMKQIFQTICRLYMNGQTYCSISELFTQVKEDILKKNKQQQQTTCVDDDQIVGVHLLKNRNISKQSLPFSSQNLERLSGFKRNSTPLHLYLFQKQNTKNQMQKIDSINVKHTFQGIQEIEDDCDQIFEYFEKFCFKDIARGDEKRDFVLNLKNVLKLHENYSIGNLNVVIHLQLFKTKKEQQD